MKTLHARYLYRIMSGINGGGRPVAAIWQGAIANSPLPDGCFPKNAFQALKYVEPLMKQYKVSSISLFLAPPILLCSGIPFFKPIRAFWGDWIDR